MPASDTGTATAGMSVARPLRRNRNTTRITSATAMTSAFSTSLTEARRVGVRSDTISMSMAAGIDACNCGSRERTRSTASRMLAPGCLNTCSKMAGLPLATPKLRTSCTESVTSATSERRMALPSFQRSTSGA